MIDVPPSASRTSRAHHKRPQTHRRRDIRRHPPQLSDRFAAVRRPRQRPHPRTPWHALSLEPLGTPSASNPLARPQPSSPPFLGHPRDGGASVPTQSSRAAAIRFFHRAAGLASPADERVVRDPLEGAGRGDADRDAAAPPSERSAVPRRPISKGRQRPRSRSAIARSYR